MPPINLRRVGIGVGVGVADVLAEKNDADNGRTEAFKSATDWLRIGLVVGGHAWGMISPRNFQMGEDLALAGTPLLVKSLNSSFGFLDGGTSGAFRGRSAAAAAPGIRNWAPTNQSASGWRAPS